ncbi:hypothetical protein DB345_21125 [Spartobacteria bacterium LR76]|nr:hypothetical protein DB345_21125 [Spartobacteria bacterium LR76]
MKDQAYGISQPNHPVSWIEHTLYQALKSLQCSFREIECRLKMVEQAIPSSGSLEKELTELKERQTDAMAQLQQLTIQIRHIESRQTTSEKEQGLMIKELKGALRSLEKLAEVLKSGST